MMFEPERLKEALGTLGAVLEDRRQTAELVVVGGGALMILGVVQRATADLDVVARVDGTRWVSAEPLPRPLQEAVRDVGTALGLDSCWLNAGPADLLTYGLPAGFVERVITRHFGALTIHLASHEDLIALKVYAAADHWPDRSKHLQDLRALKPSPAQLRAAARWCRTHDPSPGFRDQLLRPLLAHLGTELSDDE